MRGPRFENTDSISNITNQFIINNVSNSRRFIIHALYTNKYHFIPTEIIICTSFFHIKLLTFQLKEILLFCCDVYSLLYSFHLDCFHSCDNQEITKLKFSNSVSLVTYNRCLASLIRLHKKKKLMTCIIEN